MNANDIPGDWAYHDALGWQATALLFGDEYEELAGELESLIVMYRFCLFTGEADDLELQRLKHRKAAGCWTEADQQTGLRLYERNEQRQQIILAAERWRQGILERHYPATP